MPKRKGVGGRPKSADPTVVLTFRAPKSLAEKLPKDWRAQVLADLLKRHAPLPLKGC